MLRIRADPRWSRRSPGKQKGQRRWCLCLGADSGWSLADDRPSRSRLDKRLATSHATTLHLRTFRGTSLSYGGLALRMVADDPSLWDYFLAYEGGLRPLMSERQQPAGRHVAGRYHLKEPIGRGGMGIVWRAHDELLDREVAVKEVRYAAVTGEELATLNRRTMREARAAARFTHPNVIVVHDVIEEDDRPWIVMQLVPSRSLGQVIKEDGPLTPLKVAEIGLAMLEALHSAHEAGVLHRDVKPENVLLADDGRVVLTDFGIATLETETALTMTGLAGTPAFIAPERLKGLPARRESDLWSLGATLHTAQEGKAPHDRGMAMATMHAVLNDEPAPAEHAGVMRPVIEGLLAKEPVQRLTHEEATKLLRRVIAQGEAEAALAEAARNPQAETTKVVPPKESKPLPADALPAKAPQSKAAQSKAAETSEDDERPTDPSLPSVAFPETGGRLPQPAIRPVPPSAPAARLPVAEPWPEPVAPYRSEPYRSESYRAAPDRVEADRSEPEPMASRSEPVAGSYEPEYTELSRGGGNR